MAAGSASSQTNKQRKRAHAPAVGLRLQDMLRLAAEKGLVDTRDKVMLHGRIEAALVAAAKRKTGISSETELLRAALVNLAFADEYVHWLLSQAGSVDPGLDLEF